MLMRVVLGWDRPIGHFFMVIAIPEQEEEEFLYSNLDELDPFGLDLAYYKAKLDELGIQAPPGIFEQIARDKEMRVGNRYVTYSADGTFEETVMYQW